MLGVLYARVVRYISDFGWDLVCSRSRSSVLLVTNVRAFGGSEPEFRRRFLKVNTVCVGSSTGYGLLLLHVRVAVTSLGAHGEGGGLMHVRMGLVLKVVRACTGVVVLFIHIDVIATGVHGCLGPSHHL
jgi:hypothetical protein